MSTPRRYLRTFGLTCTLALLAAGCGGGDEGAYEPPADTPTPGATGDGTTVADGGGIDPNTGLPLEGEGGGATTATVPELAGDDVSGGLEPMSTSSNFRAGAVKVLPEKQKPESDSGSLFPTTKDEAGSGFGEATAPAAEKKPAVKYTGAKVYVDGIVHTVTRNGTFPKGEPIFRLLSVNANEIEIELVAGEFTSGGGVGTILDKGDLVSMVNASEQVTYRIKYLRPITDTTAMGFGG